MRIGIVGSEAIKFTARTRAIARDHIRAILSAPGVTEVVSGACHLGGIDIWAAEIGRELGLKVTEFPPKKQSWSYGYRPRNILIAKNSDAVYCITVDKLPETYDGMRFDWCYHCKTRDHVKSGGCWTAKYAQKMGKPAFWIVVNNEDKMKMLKTGKVEPKWPAKDASVGTITIDGNVVWVKV
jgi:hypothetical protein